MSNLLLKIICLISICLIGACGAADEGPDDASPETVELRYADSGPGDSAGHSLRAGDLTVTLDPRLRATHTRGRIYFKIRGQASENLKNLRVTQRDGTIRSAAIKSPRVFEIALGDEGMAHVLAGHPIFVELEPDSGTTVRARLSVSASLLPLDTSPLYLHHDLVPVRIGNEVVLRGRYQLPEGHELRQVFTDDDAEIRHDTAAAGVVDFTPFGLMLAADRPEDPVYFDTSDGAETYTRSTATVLVDIDEFGLSTAGLDEAWPQPECAPAVAECLNFLPRGELDTEPCGLAPEVEACSGEVVAPVASDPARFAADLRRELWSRYAQRDPMTLEEGALPVDEAIELVDDSTVQYVGPDLDGMRRFDPAHVDVWRHRDPITSGRAGHWYGAYDYGGNLLKLWRD